ncbi:ATP-dependent RNA helicase dbp7 [Serendipita sp. 401]|nr:ATP-dependent RNA helicase dbp7 [Serendipita sp. 401]
MADFVLNIAYDTNDDHSITQKTTKENPSKSVGKRKRPESIANSAKEQGKKRRKIDNQPVSGGKTTTPSQKPSRNIVSSLFTSNPSLTNLTLDEKPEKSPGLPSNAPLTDASTFQELGLNKLLINHLRGKMGIQKPTLIQRAALPYLLQSYDETTLPRDVFLQSQTGSGKTLAFLLPIIQDLLPLSSLSYIDRSVGTLAIIIAPTRELAKQISDVLEELLKMRLRETAEVSDDAIESRMTRWLVSGLFTGGATRTHEKARLRKGLPILVATPGRLLDHLQNSTAFNVGKCRWLVLDEADRLLELGFEETIQGILRGLDGRKKLATKAIKQNQGSDIGGWEWRERRTILCSATIREDVQKLAGTALRDPVVIKGVVDGSAAIENETPRQDNQSEKFAPPSQLNQKYIVTPLKLRLVTLVALLRSLLHEGSKRRGSAAKIIVFLSCTDSVDFHWNLLGSTSMDVADNGKTTSSEVVAQSPLLPGALIYRLHGSMPLSERLSSLKGFSLQVSKSNKDKADASEPPTILLCTSVASRGLDLPQVRAVVQYDLPTEGGATEYVHRVGRTARAGKGGEAWSFVCPSETEWVPWVEERMGKGKSEEGTPQKLNAVGYSTVLRQGFGGKGTEYEDRATEVQLAFERWVLKSSANTELARSGFKSYLRAYATHPSDEKHIFHVKNLHSGHLAKAFGLRDTPSAIGPKKTDPKISKTRRKRGTEGVKQLHIDSSEDDRDVSKTEKRMKAVVRSQGKLIKQHGVLMSTNTDEFQIASNDVLAKLAH